MEYARYFYLPQIYAYLELKGAKNVQLLRYFGTYQEDPGADTCISVYMVSELAQPKGLLLELKRRENNKEPLVCFGAKNYSLVYHG